MRYREIRRERRESRPATWSRRRRRERGPGTPSRRKETPIMLIFKALGATCMAGALAASGVITSDHLATHRLNDDRAAATLAADPHASFEALAVGEAKQVPAAGAASATVERPSTRLELSAAAPAAGL